MGYFDPNVKTLVQIQRAFRKIAGRTQLSHEHNTDFQPSESPDGSRTTFTTAKKFRAGSLEVYINGVLYLNASHFTENTTTYQGYTITSLMPTGTTIQHRYIIDSDV